MASANLTRFAWLSIGAAILTIALKTTAYWLTDSVGLMLWEAKTISPAALPISSDRPRPPTPACPLSRPSPLRARS